MNKKLVKPINSSRNQRIVGRGSGSKKGGTSGKGHKGYNARSGTASLMVFEGGQMPVVRKLPKVGFSNQPFKKEYQVVALEKLNRHYQDGEEVTSANLKQRGLISSRHKLVKIIGDGEFIKKVVITSDVAVTRSVAELLSKAGATLQEKK